MREGGRRGQGAGKAELGDAWKVVRLDAEGEKLHQGVLFRQEAILHKGFAAATGLVSLSAADGQVLDQKQEFVEGRGGLQVRTSLLQLA